MGWGTIFKMMFEFQYPVSLLAQLEEIHNQEKNYN